jgi:8-amino-7-oxononanoate synthase
MSATSSRERLADRLESVLGDRRAKGLERTLAARAENDPSLDLSANDYLSLARDPAVCAAAAAALDRWGASSSASPLISGYTQEHADLERTLCAWAGLPHGLVWNSGYAANSAVLGTLPAAGDLIVADRLAHHSLLAGALQSGARLLRFAHNDLAALRRMLAENAAPDRTVFVATESVYSMDGDSPDLAGLAALRDEFGFVWVLDEAHATGWYGPSGAGLAEEAGVTGSVDVLVGTLGKALGSAGAYTLFHDERLRRHCINFAGEFIYSTYLPPASAAAGRAAIEQVKSMGGAARAGLHAMSRDWRDALRAVVPGIPEGDSPILPIPVGDAARTLRCAAHFRSRGIRIGAVRPPTVPPGGSRLRLSLHRGLGRNELERVAAALRESLA